MAINPNELIIDKVRSLVLTNYSTGEVLCRLSKLEDPSLQTTAEGDEVVDNIGNLISKLWRAKQGKFSATNALFSLDLLAQQYGTTKEVASATNKIVTPIEETLTVSEGKVHLSHTPVEPIKYIYGGVGSSAVAIKYDVADTVSDTEFTISGTEITVPTGVTGKIYVEYEYESESAVAIRNNTENFPEAVGVKIFAIFKDVCDENKKFAGVVKAAKGKIDPSSIETALTSTGKHSVDIDFMKDYCDDDADLFTVIVAE